MTTPAPLDVEENDHQLPAPALDTGDSPSLGAPVANFDAFPDRAGAAPAERNAVRSRSRTEQHAASVPAPGLPHEASDDTAGTSQPPWTLKTVWIRTSSGASVPTALGAIPSRLDVRPGVSVEVEGGRVVIEMLKGGRRQRVDLPSELCVLEYEAPE